jgi:aminoglycoside phosphotransferase (APT) family kinase protein
MITATACPSAPLTAWLAAHAPAVQVGDQPVRVHQISGGRSNLTFRLLDDAGRSWALRRPPLGGTQATAHDMDREWRFIEALHSTPVPVPRGVAFCADQGVIGAPFYVMEFVDGVVPGSREEGLSMAPDSRGAASLACADVLAALHAVDPREAGLGDFERPGGFVERQLRRWHRQVSSAGVSDLGPFDAVRARLHERIPADPRPVVVHGDFRPGNLAFDGSGAVAAVFDWELASLGDPMVDVGWLVASWERPGRDVVTITSGPTALDGWLDVDDLVARYAERSGIGDRIAYLDYFRAFALWRSACIGAGVFRRYASGRMGVDQAEGEAVMTARLASVRAQLAAAHDALDRAP